MEQKKTADHPASDRPRSPATEARIKEKNRRILMTVSLFVFLAAGNFLMRENDRWKLRETTVIPTAVIVEGKTTDQAQSDKEDTSPLSVEEKIFAEPSKYPSSFLDALRRNPEIADFVAAYPEESGNQSCRKRFRFLSSGTNAGAMCLTDSPMWGFPDAGPPVSPWCCTA